MEALKFLSVIQDKIDLKEVSEKGLMFVDAITNSRLSKRTLVDSGTTHYCISDQEACRLELKVERDFGKMKVTLSPTHCRILQESLFKARDLVERNGSSCSSYGRLWRSVGMNFLFEHKVIQMPLVNYIVITNYNPIIIPTSIKHTIHEWDRSFKNVTWP